MAKQYKATRSKTDNSAFGQVSMFPPAMTPSKADVVRHCFYVRRVEDAKGKGSCTTQECYRIISAAIEDIWSRFSFPTISNEGIFSKVSRLMESASKLNKIPKSRRNKDFFGKLQTFDEMFDICPCDCYDNGREREQCRCGSKIPVQEWKAFVGQKQRKNQLGLIDRATTSTLRRTDDRKKKLKERQLQSEMETTTTNVLESSENLEEAMEYVDENTDDESYVPNMVLEEHEQNRYKYNELAITADRYRVSCRATAAIVNAALKDIGLLNKSNMLDRKKVERERFRVGGINTTRASSENVGLQCIGFDGRKDDTLTKNGRSKEEHYTIVKEPGSAYIDHLTPDNGTSRCIAGEILTLISDTGSKKTLKALLSDGTAVNTGKLGGVIKQIEIELDRPMQWLICQLHMNELPFRHVFEFIDGKTTGPSTFKGEIGNQIKEDLTNLQIVPFTKIHGCVQPIPDEIVKELSSDQKYLYDICLAIQSGTVPQELALKSPGNIHHARWLTRANRILRLYVSMKNPHHNLKDIVRIIMQCYSPGWFHIKTHPKATDGAQNFWYLAQLVSKTEEKYRKIMEQVLMKNSYFASPDNILLAITDERKHVRSTAINHISARNSTRQEPRNFELPKTLNLEASDYFKMINWDIEEICSPPLLNDCSNVHILKALDKPLTIPNYPCHSQNVERIVSIVTTASENRYGYEKRHRYIMNLLESKAKMPKFDWKGQWN